MSFWTKLTTNFDESYDNALSGLFYKKTNEMVKKLELETPNGTFKGLDAVKEWQNQLETQYGKNSQMSLEVG